MKKYLVILCLMVFLTSCKSNNASHPINISTVDEQVTTSDSPTFKEKIDALPVIEHHLENEKIKVNINQVGYLPKDKKIAIFRGEGSTQHFYLRDAETDEIVFEGTITDEFENVQAGEVNAYGNFSDYQKDGHYYISSDYGDSFSFEIRENVYDDLLVDISRMFYLQRCGINLDESFAADFSHNSCHDDLALIYDTETTIDVSGGWHDAGDYGRYVVPAAKTIADLILSYVASNDNMSIPLNIPESDNQIPDILDEVYYELTWFLKMQDKETGGVYHKVTGRNFPGTTMPDIDTSIMIVSPISDAATADFSAVMAMSSDVYKDYLPDFSKVCLEASKRAYDYLSVKDKFIPFNNPEGISTGQYGDDHMADEMFWASVELYKVTADIKYHDAIKKYYNKKYLALGWDDMGGYGAYRYLTLPDSIKDKEFGEKVTTDFLKKADNYINLSNKNGYLISMNSNYPWGSNMTVANHAMFLQLAYDLNKNPDYLIVADHHLNYLLGNNPMAMSYVTGYGSLSPIATHHRPSQFLRQSMIGMLVGGPNSDLEDPYAAETLRDVPPAKCYLDVAQSYSCNEVTIYWNSPLLYILSQQ